ncbi:MAG: hypothetical protein ACK6D5_16725, partial [Planctomyces sp.]
FRRVVPDGDELRARFGGGLARGWASETCSAVGWVCGSAGASPWDGETVLNLSICLFPSAFTR